MAPKSGLRGKGLIALGAVIALCVIGIGSGLFFAVRSEGEASSAKTEAAIHATPPASPGPPESSLSTLAPSAQLTGTVDSQSQFVWPTTGPMTSYMGPGHPTGVDIGMSYGEDSLVRAAAGGIVTFAGGDPCCDYGLHVEIDHGDGWSTLYGHFSKIGVKTGQEVDQGSLLGLGGDTGFAIGKHLHFEIRQDDDNYVDPLRYLPPDQVRKRPTTAFSCPDAPIAIDPDSRAAFNFTSPAMSTSKLVSVTVSPQRPGFGEPPLEATQLGNLNLVVTAGTPDNASGRAFDYNLALSFVSNTGDASHYTCVLRLKTMQSFPTMIRAERPVAPPTKRPATFTPKPKAPATNTPKPSATNTPQPQSQTQTSNTPSLPKPMPGVPTSIPTATPPTNKPPPVTTPKR